jgi:hypothetical protein
MQVYRGFVGFVTTQPGSAHRPNVTDGSQVLFFAVRQIVNNLCARYGRFIIEVNVRYETVL